MATNLNLKYTEATAQARIVEANADEINRILQNLVNEVSSNVNNSSVWSGNSASSFLAKWNECADSFNNFVNHIKTIQQKIDYSATQVSGFDNN